MTEPLSDSQQNELVEAATEARRRAYAPYSKFAVGAAVLCDDGRLFRGANVENASYGLTICAERVAAATAVASGARKFKAVAVACDGGHAPCGTCRQFLAEWGGDLTIICADTQSDAAPRRYALNDLLPCAFRLNDV